MKFYKFNIRRKITSSFLLLVFTIILIFAFFSYYRVSNAMQTEIQGHGKNMITVFTQMASTYIFENDYATFLDNAKQLVENSEILLIAIMDTRGNIWASTEKKDKRKIPVDSFYQETIRNKQIDHRHIRHKNGQKSIEFVSPVMALGKVVYLVKIEISLEKMEIQAAEQIKGIVVITVGMTLFAFFLGIFLSKFLTDPLNKLVQGTSEISRGNLDHKIEVDSSDEIGILARSFNIMTDKLKKELSKRSRAEKKIQNARDELEVRVAKRTAELQQEIEDRAEAEQKYQMLMDASPVPIVVYDMEGNILYINPSFTRTFGWTLEEVQWKKIDYVPEEESVRTHKMVEVLSKGEGYHGFETRRYTKDKALLDVSISYAVWKGHDNIPRGSVVILHDITKRKQLELQLLQSRKMEAMGTLAGGIAHDFNNILSGIFAYSQLADSNISNTERARKHIKQIIKGAHRAAGLTQQILTFSRQAESQKQPQALFPIMKEVLKLIRPTLPATIEVKINFMSAQWVLADATQVHQVIMNLCTNAYHAMADNGGTLTVGLAEVGITRQQTLAGINLRPGQYLRMEVSDTGHGMDRATLEKVFDPYFTTKGMGKSTGFGLAIVKAIVEDHSGCVQVKSVPGKGSSFYVYLPVAENPPGLVEERQEIDIVPEGTEKIMVVDDEEAIRLGIKEFLEDYGYQVSVFENGMLAFEAFLKAPDQFDLVITDMTMPQMTGDVFSTKILEIRKNLPIILCTGYSENISRGKALKIGIRKYVSKPILNKELALLIRAELDQRKSAD